MQQKTVFLISVLMLLSLMVWAMPAAAETVTIAQIQETPDGLAGPSPYEGQEVTFSGVVTRRTMNNYFVQDGSGPWSGILINHFFNNVAEGDNVTLTGFVSESNGMTMLSMPATTTNSNGNPIPDATVITNADLGEAYEGVLITINNAECIGVSGQEWKIDDTTGLATVGTYCTVYTPTIGTVYNVTGIGNETIDGYRINPRSATDVVEVPQGPSVVTIAQIQETPDGLAGPSPYEGQEVTFSGVVTRRTMNNYFVQDGSGPWSGILINHFFNNVAEGDNVTLTGFVSESNGMTMLSMPATTINSNGNPIP
ncbi:MAG: hypothetical protein J7K89_07845, partial [Candidatus Cloacimonetes bacterium]|nr:hypothetical protein [Candidatus Cloacimonadota bacterium]